MKAKVVKVSKGRTVNIGRYNTVRFDYGIEVELEEGDKAADAARYAEKFVDELVDKEHLKWER